MKLLNVRKDGGSIQFYNKKKIQSFSLRFLCNSTLSSYIVNIIVRKVSFTLRTLIGKSIVTAEEGEHRQTLKVNVTMPKILDSYGATLVANECYEAAADILCEWGLT